MFDRFRRRNLPEVRSLRPVGERVMLIRRGRDGDIATLVIPSSTGADTFPVEIDSNLSVVKTQSGLILDRNTFQLMREAWGAFLLADDPELIMNLLEISGDEGGVVPRLGAA